MQTKTESIRQPHHPSTTRAVPTTPSLHHSTAPLYALRKGLGAWDLTFDGHRAVIKHEQGMYYVAYLLANPPSEPIHALDLATRVAAILRKDPGFTEIPDPTTGRAVPLDCNSRIQERSLGLDAAETMRAVIRQETELEAMLEDEDTVGPAKEEIQRELIDLYRYEEKNTAQIRDNAQRAVRTVRMAIKRLYDDLATAVDAEGRPHPVLRPFAAHIHQYMLIPSGRYSQPGRASARAAAPGCFTYESPGITWAR